MVGEQDLVCESTGQTVCLNRLTICRYFVSGFAKVCVHPVLDYDTTLML